MKLNRQDDGTWSLSSLSECELRFLARAASLARRQVNSSVPLKPLAWGREVDLDPETLLTSADLLSLEQLLSSRREEELSLRGEPFYRS